MRVEAGPFRGKRVVYVWYGDEDLTHAIGQIRNWQSWIDDHREYARKLLPRIDHPIGLLFMGRRTELQSAAARDRMRQITYGHRMFVRFHTLDWFASAAASVLNLVKGGGGWRLPMDACTHKQLTDGLPDVARKWVDAPFAKATDEDLRKSRLDERRSRYADYENELA